MTKIGEIVNFNNLPQQPLINEIANFVIRHLQRNIMFPEVFHAIIFTILEDMGFPLELPWFAVLPGDCLSGASYDRFRYCILINGRGTRRRTKKRGLTFRNTLLTLMKIIVRLWRLIFPWRNLSDEGVIRYGIDRTYFFLSVGG